MRCCLFDGTEPQNGDRYRPSQLNVPWKVYSKEQARKEIQKVRECKKCGQKGKPKVRWEKDAWQEDVNFGICVYADGFELNCATCGHRLGFVALTDLYAHWTTR